MARKQRLESLQERYLKTGLGGLTDYELLHKMEEIGHREGAFQELLRRVTSSYNLRYIMRFFESHREKAWQAWLRLYLNSHHGSYDLEYIREFVKPLKMKASRLLKRIEIAKERRRA